MSRRTITVSSETIAATLLHLKHGAGVMTAGDLALAQTYIQNAINERLARLEAEENARLGFDDDNADLPAFDDSVPE